MCTDLGPDFQEAEHARLLPGLMAVMDDFQHPRIQAHAAAAIVNFSENCEQAAALAAHNDIPKFPWSTVLYILATCEQPALLLYGIYPVSAPP